MVTATARQRSYIAALMREKGFVHPRGFLHGDAKRIPHGPTARFYRMGERGLAAWLDTLTKRQASEVIDWLLGA